LNTAISGDPVTRRVGHTGHIDGQQASIRGAAPRHPHRGGKGNLQRTINAATPGGRPDADEHLLVQRAGGEQDLNVGIHLSSIRRPDRGALIDPDGETVDVDSNATSVNSTTA